MQRLLHGIDLILKIIDLVNGMIELTNYLT